MAKGQFSKENESSLLTTEGRGGIVEFKKVQVREMRDAQTILGLIRERGSRGLPLERVYRLLFSRELYLTAYGRIYRNKGAMTPGSTEETVDSMSLQKIDTIIDALRQERYQWAPVRRVSIEKKHSTKKRPLGIPSWSDKLLQEIIRMILEAYYEPTFSPHSHGFRPERGCHTALREIYQTWTGVVWFLEGDIAQCFTSLDHPLLVEILSENIHDGRFIRLIKELLKAGYAGGLEVPRNAQWNTSGKHLHASYNVAKKVIGFEFEERIPRTRLCSSYGDGFKGAPLRCTPPSKDALPRDSSTDDENSISQLPQAIGGPYHV